MSDKPTQAEYEAMKRLVEHQANQAMKLRWEFEERGDPATFAAREERLWREVLECVNACQRVDRITRVVEIDFPLPAGERTSND